MIYPHYSVDIDFGSGWTQALMLTDEARLNAYREALEKYANGKSVLELGTGSGVLCQYAETAGASQITGIESNDEAFRFGTLRNDLFGSANVSLIHNDVIHARVNKHDLIVFELFGGRMLDESVISILREFKALNTWASSRNVRFLPYRGKLLAKAVFVPDLIETGSLPAKTNQATNLDSKARLLWATSPNDLISASNWISILDYSFGGPTKSHKSVVTVPIHLKRPANALLWGFTLMFDEHISLDVRLGESQTTSWGGTIELLNPPKSQLTGDFSLSVTIPEVFDGTEATFSPILQPI